MMTASDYVDQNSERLLQIIEDLISIPTENRSPEGNEAAAQRYIQDVLQSCGYETDLYMLDEVATLDGHPLASVGRAYPDRPAIAARRAGEGGGRSLLLSGHIDTVPAGTLPWTTQPFRPSRVGNRLYGRGSNDMKAGIGINLFLMEALAKMGTRLDGDLVFESVIDEEFGGVNGTLAGRLRGYMADAAVLTEPSGLRICAGQRGGRTAHLLFTSGGGVLSGALSGGGVVDQLTYFLNRLPEFATQRRAGCAVHSLYAHCDDPVPVTVTKITTGPWGTSEPITVPEEARVELYWQLMPGETQEEIEREFLAWLESVVVSAGGLFARAPKVSFPVRWLPGSVIPAESDVCTALQSACVAESGVTPAVVGIEGPCDLFVFHEFGIPAVLWGPSGGQTHGSDEYVEIDSVVTAAKVLLRFVQDWCGTAA